MKKYIKENKKLLIKYSLIIVSNILLVILNNFYLKNNNYKNMILLFKSFISGKSIYSSFSSDIT